MSEGHANGAHGRPGPVPVERLSALTLEGRIRSKLHCLSLQLTDDSHKHAGHAGAEGGAAHFTLHLVSEDFVGLSRVARHRLVYDAVSDLMPHRLHALVIDARTAAEAGAAPTSLPPTRTPS
jgi:BolA protein